MNYETLRSQLADKATQCIPDAAAVKDLLEAAAQAIADMQKRIQELESEAADLLTAKHGDLIDRDELIADLLLDKSIEVMARTQIVNDYIVHALEQAPVIVPSNIQRK